MQLLLNELRDSIIAHLSKNKKLVTPPTMEHKTKNKYSICSGNFFKESSDIQPAVDEVIEKVENTIRSHIGSKGGEVIKSVIRGGEIWDTDKKYFEIKSGAHFESYCYSCKTLTFVRVGLEKQLFPPEKEWPSIDVDEVQDSIWLEES